MNLSKGFVSLIDPSDAEFVGQWSWAALFIRGRQPRAVRRENKDGKTRYLHREVVKADDGDVVDHIDGDTLNNRKSNLRPCSRLQNNWNAKKKAYGKSSRFKGVTKDRYTGLWAADIRAGERYRLGRFATEEEAARAYDRKAVELHGEFARTNQTLGLLPQEG